MRIGPTAGVLAGQALRLDLPEESTVRYTRDDWKTQADVATRDTALGLHVAELPTAGIAPGRKLTFTWRRKQTRPVVGGIFENSHVIAPRAQT